ncbi:hypothetical protein MTO96_020558 [Rhipicephalus appendiculatus]
MLSLPYFPRDRRESVPEREHRIALPRHQANYVDDAQDAEETLTDTDKAGAIGSSTDPNAASLPVTEHKNDPQLGEGMAEDSNAFTIATDTAQEDAYNGACRKLVRTKRRARNAAALEAASPLTTYSENPFTKPRLSVAKRLPPLPFRDEKAVLRPLGGLRLDQWPRPTSAAALWAAAGVSPNDRRNLILRTRPEQDLAVISTSSSHVADALLKVQELLLGQRTYPCVIKALKRTSQDSHD